MLELLRGASVRFFQLFRQSVGARRRVVQSFRRKHPRKGGHREGRPVRHLSSVGAHAPPLFFKQFTDVVALSFVWGEMSLLPRGASVGPTSQLRHLEGPQLHGDRPSALQPRGKPASRRALTDISNNKSYVGFPACCGAVWPFSLPECRVCLNQWSAAEGTRTVYSVWNHCCNRFLFLFFFVWCVCVRALSLAALIPALQSPKACRHRSAQQSVLRCLCRLHCSPASHFVCLCGLMCVCTCGYVCPLRSLSPSLSPQHAVPPPQKKGLGLSARPSAAPKPTPRRAGLPSAGLGFGLGFGTPMGMRARPRPRKTPSAAAAPPAAAAAPPTVASAPSHSTAAVADDDDDEVGFCWNQRLGSDAELEALEAALDKEIDIDALLGPDLIVDGTAQCLPLDSSLDEGSDVDINAGL